MQYEVRNVNDVFYVYETEIVNVYNIVKRIPKKRIDKKQRGCFRHMRKKQGMSQAAHHLDDLNSSLLMSVI